VWLFELGGEVAYTGEVVEQRAARGYRQLGTERVQVSDRYPVALRSVPIPGGRRLSAPLIRLLPGYQLGALQAYDPRYLADWPAELYDVSLADASLDARSQGYALIQREMAVRLLPLKVLSTGSAGLVIDSFRLALFPVWATEITLDGRRCLVLINGQTGEVYGDIQSRPLHAGGILSWLSDLVGE
jgi:hypothetical protein